MPPEGDPDVPGLPQTTQRFELLQSVLAAEHLLPAQHGCPAPPQGTQVLAVLLLVLLHAVPGSRQAPPTAVDAQQVCPVAPHALQMYAEAPELLSEKHWVPGSVHRLFEQHGPPDLPQAAHTEVV